MLNSADDEADVNITVFLGAPGSGKGTQAKKLSTQHQVHHISTGDLLRSEMKRGSDVGLRAKKFVDAGELVPDGVMIDMLKGQMAHLSPDAKVVLDGFPRTVKQAEALDNSDMTHVNRALYFEVPEEVLVKRLTGRRTCPNCGESYHMEFLPPKKDQVCDKCSGKLVQRPDDSEDVVKRRLEVFHEQNKQLLSYYQNQGRLKKLNGDREVEALQTDLVRLLQ